MVIYISNRNLHFFWFNDLFCIRRMNTDFLLRLKWLRIIFTFTFWFWFGSGVKLFLFFRMIFIKGFLVFAVVLCFWSSRLDDRYMLFISLRRRERQLFMLFSIWFRSWFRSGFGFRLRIIIMSWVRIFHIMKKIYWNIDIT